jgi:Asp-tRNA(Asn)/Glu-tRNA(Gln) amidotransferase A subunit family amidase
VGFSIGSETQGSIVSPAARCGVAGLRPTFGVVPRTGAMTLSWSMDKLGPICRSAEDCALVLEAIRGPDGRDLSVRAVAFDWDPALRMRGVRVGYLKSAFEREKDHADRALDDAALAVVRRLAGTLVPVELPTRYPLEPLSIILRAESAAVFDELVRSGRVDLLERSSRPRTLREARFIPAVEYINANRARALVMLALHEALREVDLFVAPTSAENLSQVTNLTGHPVIAVPSGVRDDGTLASLAFVGQLWGEPKIVAAAREYQEATGFHLKRPPRFAV